MPREAVSCFVFRLSFRFLVFSRLRIWWSLLPNPAGPISLPHSSLIEDGSFYRIEWLKSRLQEAMRSVLVCVRNPEVRKTGSSSRDTRYAMSLQALRNHWASIYLTELSKPEVILGYIISALAVGPCPLSHVPCTFYLETLLGTAYWRLETMSLYGT